jgi:diguanylate cyclase (GGDEF)-like protein/PAS domain S-box-containing protein
MDETNTFPNVTCSVTGLALRQLEEWKDVAMGPSFSSGFKIIGTKTLVIEGRGFANFSAEVASVEYGINIVKNHMNSPSECLIIQDWKDFKNASWRARNYFMKNIVNDAALAGIIFCNATPRQEMSVLLAKKMKILNTDIRICNTYTEAALMAARFEQLGQLPEVRDSLLQKLRSWGKYRRDRTFNQPILDLLEYLNSIDWTSRKPRPSSYSIESNHPLLPIFDALTLIKSQLDKTTVERDQFMKSLLEQQEMLEEELENRTQKIREGEQYFSRILEYSPVSIVLLDKALNISYINQMVEDSFEYTRNDLKGVGFLETLFCHLDVTAEAYLRSQLETLLPPPAEPGCYGPVEIQIPAKDGTIHFTETTFTSIEEGYLVTIVDVSLRKKAEEKLYSLSVTDSMTGFYNRRHYQDCIEKEFLRAERYGHPLTLIVFDVDFFKRINDQYGHPAGDAVLRHLAALSRDCFRTTDLQFRIGGEEFAILLPESAEDLGWIAAERFRRSVEVNSTPYEDILIPHTISLGIATTGDKTERVEDFIKRTDIALYQAKHLGRNRTETAFS